MCQAFLAYPMHARKNLHFAGKPFKAMNLTLDKHTSKVESNFVNPGIASLDSGEFSNVSIL